VKHIRWLITIAYAAVIFYLSSRTWGGTVLFPYADKVIHFLIYAGLGLLIAWSLRATVKLPRAQLVLLAAALTTLYGVSDEVHQLFVPGRSFEVADALVDALGGIAGALAAVLLAKGCRRKGAAGAHQPA
jgi:VanZ family protein